MPTDVMQIKRVLTDHMVNFEAFYCFGSAIQCQNDEIIINWRNVWMETSARPVGSKPTLTRLALRYIISTWVKQFNTLPTKTHADANN